MQTLEEAAVKLVGKAREHVLTMEKMFAMLGQPVLEEFRDMHERFTFGGEEYDAAYSIVRGPKNLIHLLTVYNPRTRMVPDELASKQIAIAILPKPSENIRVLPEGEVRNFTGAKKRCFVFMSPVPTPSS